MRSLLLPHCGFNNHYLCLHKPSPKFTPTPCMHVLHSSRRKRKKKRYLEAAITHCLLYQRLHERDRTIRSNEIPPVDHRPKPVVGISPLLTFRLVDMTSYFGWLTWQAIRCLLRAHSDTDARCIWNHEHV